MQAKSELIGLHIYSFFMVFNSLAFAGFFIIVFILYYLIGRKSNRLQNYVLLVASYVFYGFASLKILPILVITTVIFYFLGLKIKSASEDIASRLKTLGVVLGVGLLLYFKYLNFFIESFASLFEMLGLHTNWHTFNIIMPLGISFFTFKLISYVIEVEHEDIEPSKDFVQFANYVAFFPCILSGPIDRPNEFLPQLNKKKEFSFEMVNEGIMQFMWGLFKKVVIADNCAVVVDSVWGALEYQNGATLLYTAFIYFFQIYADFSGYSDMAIGVGKLLGIKVTKNFDHPLFSLNIADYWRKWHISLTKWMTDYVFTPLNFIFRRKGNFGMVIAIAINFLLVGLWHGANWVYALIGLLQVVWFLPLIISGRFMNNEEIQVTKVGLPTVKCFGKIVVSYVMIMINGILFRSENLTDFWLYIKRMCTKSIISLPSFAGEVNTCAILSLLFILFFVVLEWISRKQDFFLQNSKNIFVRCFFLAFYVITIYYLGESSDAFIYFQF